MVNCGINIVFIGIISKVSKKLNRIFLFEKFIFVKVKLVSVLIIIELIVNVLV